MPSYYTKSQNPQVGDAIYNSSGVDTGMTIDSVSGSTITFGNDASIMRSLFRVADNNGNLTKPTLTKFKLPDGVTDLGERCLLGKFFKFTSLVLADLSGLTAVSGYQAMNQTFSGCSSLTSVNLNDLASITGSQALFYAFRNCTHLSTLSFPALTSSAFGSETNQFNNMLAGVTGCTVHFPSNLQAVIGSWSDVTGGFGGTSTTVLYDLPATT